MSIRTNLCVGTPAKMSRASSRTRTSTCRTSGPYPTVWKAAFGRLMIVSLSLSSRPMGLGSVPAYSLLSAARCALLDPRQRCPKAHSNKTTFPQETDPRISSHSPPQPLDNYKFGIPYPTLTARVFLIRKPQAFMYSVALPMTVLTTLCGACWGT